MTRLRISAAIFLVIAVMAMGLVPLVAEAQIPPALYRCTVYDCDVLVGAGVTVDVYVGTETTPRASGTTDANGVCVLSVSVTQDEVIQSEAISFKVDGVLADELPEVDVTLEAPEVDLDICANPPVADADGPYAGYEGQTISIFGSASGGTPPYSYAWDMDDDGYYDDSYVQNPTWSWGMAGDYSIGLKVTDNAAQEDTDTASVHIEAVSVCTWQFPHGIIDNPTALFPRHYECATVTLGDIPLQDIPEELVVVWHYDEAAMVWEWFRPSWGESTLITLEYCNIYLIVVMSQCTWNIPQS